MYNIYILENDGGFIKIGITTDFDQRLKSLSGSNGGGHKITRYFVSEPTHLYTLERVMHITYQDYRIEDTEWFDFTGTDITFDTCVFKLKTFMNSDSYKKCNQIRKEFETEIVYTDPETNKTFSINEHIFNSIVKESQAKESGTKKLTYEELLNSKDWAS